MASTVKVDKIRGSASTEVKLDGNLDVNGNSIVSASNGNIAITPNGSGKVIVDGLSLPTADGSANQLLKTDGSANISFGTLDISTDPSPQLGADLDVNGNSIVSTSNANINITPNGTGDVNLGADTVMVGDNNANATITTQGTGDLTLSTNSGTNSGTIAIADGANGNISITPNGSGNIVLDGLTFPNADGSANQTLVTNGSGTLSFTDAGGGKVLQVVNALKDDMFTTSSTSFTDVTGLTANITPSNTASKVLVIASVRGMRGKNNSTVGGLTIARGGTNLIVPDTPQNRTPSFVWGYGSDDTNHSFNMDSYHMTFLDSPNTTSQQTYAVRVKNQYGSSTFYINRAENQENSGDRPQSVSSLILMEIGA